MNATEEPVYILPVSCFFLAMRRVRATDPMEDVRYNVFYSTEFLFIHMDIYR